MALTIIIAAIVPPRKAGGAVASALLLWASFFPGQGILVWFALAPLFVVLLGEGRRGRAALTGGIFGFLFFLLEFSGLLGLRVAVGPVGAALALGGMGLYGAAWGAAFGALAARGGVPRLIGLWVLLECLRASGPLGVAIGTVPLGLVGTPLVRAAAFGGPWSLALAVVATNASVAALIRTRRPAWLGAVVAGPLLLGVLALVWSAPHPRGELVVALVQPGITVVDRLEVSPYALLRRYRSPLAEVPGDVDLVVLPEDVLPAILRREPTLLSAFREEAARLGTPLILGSWDREGGRFYNTAFRISPAGELEIAHRKVRLLPFGEYLPLRPLWERLGLGQLVQEFLPREISPGPGLSAFGRYGILICSESQFPGFTRALVRDGAEVIIVLTNDSWFGASRILWEHFACGALRAVETGRAFLQAAITGITGGFGPDGRLLGTLSEQKSGTLTVRVPLHDGATPYVRLGDRPALVFCLVLLIAPLFSRWPRRCARRCPPP
ncbi:apolipoprotein N-acyltransferase [Candidatus Bipolaricaulota sp. J31]